MNKNLLSDPISAQSGPFPTLAAPTVSKGILSLVFLASIALASAQTDQDNFNTGTDTGWTRFDLSGAGLPAAAYTFPDDGNGGKAYRIKAPPPPAAVGDQAGPGRAFSYRNNTYSRLSVSVDFLSWDTTVDQAVGLLIRADPIGLGATDGYSMNYNVADGNLQINELTGEAPTTIAQTPVPLNPFVAHYRFVFTAFDANLVGQVYALPDLTNPVAAVVATDAAHPSGKLGLLVFDRNDPETYTGADATFDNYAASVPATGALGATVVQLSPRPNEAVRTIPGNLTVAILDRETQVDASSIVLTVDGQVVPSSAITLTTGVIMPNNPDAFPGATVTYPFPNQTNLAALTAVHTNRVTFKDNTGVAQTNEWTFTYAGLTPANAAPPGSGTNPGFDVRLVRAPEGSPALPNTLSRAELQLATNAPATLVGFQTNVVVDLINFSMKDTNAENYVPDGHFAADQNLPGIDPLAEPNPVDLAMEFQFYLEIPAGIHTLGVTSDDGFQLRSGSSITDTNALVLGEKTSGTFDGTFDIAIEKTGLYPCRMVWFQRGGGAHVELYSVDRQSGERVLINDPLNPIKAFRSISAPTLVLESATELKTGGFAALGNAVVDTVNQTITVPADGSQRFYRIRSNQAVTIKTIGFSTNNVVLTYAP